MTANSRSTDNPSQTRPGPDTLVLRLATDGGLTWRLAGRAGVSTMTGAPPAGVLAGARRIVVLVPSEDVLLTHARLPARTPAQRRQGVPFALEDELLSPVESLHFALGPAEGDDVDVAVVATDTLRGWLATLAAAGVKPDAMLPDALALPWDGAHARALIEDDRARVRLGRNAAIACAPGDLPAWLAGMSGAGEPAPIEVIDARTGGAPPLPWPVASRRVVPGAALAVLATGSLDGLDLLQGEFTPRHRRAPARHWWRVAAILAGATIVLAFAASGVDALRLRSEARALEAAQVDVLRKAFPDLDAQALSRASAADLMRGRLERLRGDAGSGDFTRLLGRIAPVLGRATRVQTRGLEFRTGVMTLTLRAPDVATLDSVREQFAALPGIKVELVSANAGAGGVDGQLRISGGAP